MATKKWIFSLTARVVLASLTIFSLWAAHYKLFLIGGGDDLFLYSQAYVAAERFVFPLYFLAASIVMSDNFLRFRRVRAALFSGLLWFIFFMWYVGYDYASYAFREIFFPDGGHVVWVRILLALREFVFYFIDAVIVLFLLLGFSLEKNQISAKTSL